MHSCFMSCLQGLGLGLERAGLSLGLGLGTAGLGLGLVTAGLDYNTGDSILARGGRIGE